MATAIDIVRESDSQRLALAMPVRWTLEGIRVVFSATKNSLGRLVDSWIDLLSGGFAYCIVTNIVRNCLAQISMMRFTVSNSDINLPLGAI